MSATGREAQLGSIFVRLADTMVDDYDMVDLLDTLVQECKLVLDVSEAGLVLADSDAGLQVMASTSERSSLIEALQLRSHEGPCMQCYATGEVVTIEDIRKLGDRWPMFAELALEQGIRSVHAVPMRLRGRTIGALNLFSERTGMLGADDAAIAQALADVATISIMQERMSREQAIVGEQLQRALDARVVIEQAKGVLAQSHRIPVDDAFVRLRAYARVNDARLVDVASQVVRRQITV
ncbi:GAF domain-containing protein [Glaciihabitans tibetensis]|uniref:GAF domain-containing protein n=1 Tax=Glaciihabitans tibetensis TaxID=1266600 RepID=A0A2T0VK92_9MICO|nr:GAF and ANTAR domain-containing protein [Glaciihabitans tibetensis]PRY70603.1 GAF domain-containing protein [Glaciihabitans tibetensis]